MKEMQVRNYEELVQKVNEEKNKVSVSLLTIGKICLEAKKILGIPEWKRWLADSRVNLKISQARKFIAVYQCYKNNSQSTVFLNNKGIEHTYLLTRIKDGNCRNEAETLIEDENLSVSQTRRLVKILKQDEDMSCQDALVKIMTVPKKSEKAQHQMISLEEYNSLKEKYESLLQENKALENQIRLLEAKPIKAKEVNKVLDKPVKTTLEDGTINKEKHSIVVGEYELPVPSGVNIETVSADLIKMSAINNAKNNFGLNIKDEVSDTGSGTKVVK